MALPSPIVIMLAKSYAHQLAEHGDPAAARRYIAEEFGAATPSQIRSAIRQAQRAMAVGERLSHLPLTAQISEALEGNRPAERVGVRVVVTRHEVDQGGDVEDRQNTLYVQVPWDATVQDVIQRVRSWFERTERNSGPAVAWSVEFSGPTLWPGQTVPLYGGL